MSLRARLLLGMAVVAVVLGAAAVAITRATERNLINQVDQQLERAGPLLRGAGGPDRGGSEGTEAPPSSLYVAVLDPTTGEPTTLFLPSTVDDPSEPDLSGEEALAQEGRGPFTVPATDGDLRYRAEVRPGARNGRPVLLALPLEDVDEAIRQLVTIQALASVTILAALGLATFWVLRLGVRPVQEMTETATAIGQGDLSRRIPEGPEGTEAGDLGIALNQMLSRIEGAFDEQSRSEERLRRFVADASHELRTPVTTIRGYAELYRVGGLAPGVELDEAMRRTEQEATRMGQLVADLLALARMDQGRPLEQHPVDLAALAADAVADARAVEPERPLHLDAPDPGVAMVVGDEALLRQILANLMANARVHTDPSVAVRVQVTVSSAPRTVVVEVIDAGPGMEPEVAAQVFERFYRADPARTRHRGGSGLGLSIVASAVAAHQGTVELDTRPGQGTVVRVILPAGASREGGGPLPGTSQVGLVP